MTPPRLARLRRRIAPDGGGRRTVAAPVALALLVLAAGCAGAVAGLPGTAPQPYTETGAALNGSDLRSAHVDGLRSAGSFESNTTLVVEGEEHEFTVDRSGAVDASADRSLATTRYDSDAVEGDGLEVRRYTDGSTTYRQVDIETDQGAIVRSDAATAPYDDGLLAVQPVDADAVARADLVEAVVDDVEWTQVGVERYDGGWVTRYEASGPENVSSVGSTAMEAGDGQTADRTELPETLDVDVRSFDATLLVSPDGVVRKVSVRAAGNAAGHPTTLALTFETEDLGDATVDEPGWVGSARTVATG